MKAQQFRVTANADNTVSVDSVEASSTYSPENNKYIATTASLTATLTTVRDAIFSASAERVLSVIVNEGGTFSVMDETGAEISDPAPVPLYVSANVSGAIDALANSMQDGK